MVGNIVIGGAGKTPTVIALVEGLRRRGWTPGVVSRGYGAGRDRRDLPGRVTADSDPAVVGDEPLVIHRRTGAAVWVDRDRPAAVRSLLRHHPQVDVVVSDDGLQHWPLHRDGEVLVFDERGVGNGLLLPAGPLREPMPRAVEPQAIVVYNAPSASTPLPGLLAERRLGPIRPWLQWHRGDTGPGLSEETLRSRTWRAVAGTGHPERFFAMLESAGLTIVRCPLPDHATLRPRPWIDDGMPVLLTEKDAVKVRPDDVDLPSIHVATLDFQLPEEVLEWAHRRLASRRGGFIAPTTERCA